MTAIGTGADEIKNSPWRQLTTHSGRKLIGQPAPDSPESYYRFHHKAD